VLHSTSGRGLSPNAWSWQSNAMASILAHELAESVTDPLATGWFSRGGAETGDICAWTFGSTATASGACNGTSPCAPHNIVMGGIKLLVQQLVRQVPPKPAGTGAVAGTCSMCASATCPRPV
jgi:hypothetical protein